MMVIIAPRAEADIEAIADHVSESSPAAALRTARELRARCEGLNRFPERGRAREDVRAGLRSIIHGNYVILYRVLPDHVRIERVAHGARDLADMFDDDAP